MHNYPGDIMREQFEIIRPDLEVREKMGEKSEIAGNRDNGRKKRDDSRIHFRTKRKFYSIEF